MAKKKLVEPVEFNMSEVVREGLGANPKASTQEIQEYIQAKYPGAVINDGSFKVAFYTARKKMGITPKRGGGKVGIKSRKIASGTAGSNLPLGAIKAALELLKEAGSEADAIQMIKALGQEVGKG